MTHPTLNSLYKHQDGGFYFVHSVAISADDLSEWVVYSHVWPFEQKQWTRRIEEWTPERFALTTNKECAMMMTTYTREEYQLIVTDNKAARQLKTRSA